ncbi:nucleotide exchange factor SIL1-like [Amyelois transitella]|uniref:nucleotide exchange factor SIL1-like n=1 Tax=Amyelois transitella TaxID=680683 RepID=UPI00067BCFAD|nr:nucleotide exchange factor SIL1-like [Amyelois transitella]
MLEISTPAFEVASQEEHEHDSITELLAIDKIDKAIEDIEQISSLADKSYREGILPIEEIEKMYNDINVKFDDIIEMMTNPNNVYEFLNAKGLDRVVITNLETPYTALRTNILILLKTLFDMAPITINAVMPARMIDKVLDIFENDDDIGIKAHAIDVLHAWLPGNPRVQARVMKVKGLVPFYEQMTKLDLKSLHTLLDLFNKVLEEHILVRQKKTQMTKRDSDELKMYQRIGLIEHMSRKDVCNGLLDIFRNTWASTSAENDIVVPILDLSAKIGPFCLKSFKGKPKALDLFDAFLKYLKEDNRGEYFEKYDMNASNVETAIADYVNSLKQGNEKDEF